MPGFKEFAIEWGENRQTNNKTLEIEINLFNKYLLTILYLPANVLSAREIAINYKQTNKQVTNISNLLEHALSWRERNDNKVKYTVSQGLINGVGGPK